ncbi:CocE/NonD family hydrolase [Streptomyces sp. HC44]|uniref:CocE/NonD family hydrolase n=1 Tax=Streptomyces scabichelini TaxID=2711217 RepID=A0A6G4VA74_9ACTN|nr:CocE/NonD family hydrolase [Streptomyces scabichelini]NGO10714.1 CocE/NonD family hydrolase [Streptomyces scabichelini]
MKKIPVPAAATAAVAALALTGGSVGPAGAAQSAAPTVATAEDPVTHRDNNRVPKGAEWTQHYFPSSDGSGTELHADVLLPERLPQGEKVPVILSVGAYFGHSGELTDEKWKKTGPSARFKDLVEGGDLFDRGYALVQVDLRGFGGSSGCLDYMGKGEQADVKAAIDWAAKQPWSTGKVGMYGKSYDATTALVGNNLDQDALKAVVAQEPVWDMYRLTRSNRVPKLGGVLAPNTYNQIAQLPPLPDDQERYKRNNRYELKHPECTAYNTDNNLKPDPEDPYWRQRDLAKQAKGSDTPLFFTQGFIESNTKPEAMQEYLAGHQGTERGWLGQWDHVRGNERTEDGRLQMGRAGWFKEVMSFYDQHLKGIAPTTDYPAFAVQDSTGAWRSQDTWPLSDRSADVVLRDGSYVDQGEPGDSANFLTWSEPVERDIRITRTPRIEMDTEGSGNVMVKLYDVAQDGSAVMFDEQVAIVDASGHVAMDLKSTDWRLKAGHSLAVEIGTVYDGAWIDTPTGDRIKVTDARLGLSVDDPSDDQATEGKRSPYLDTYVKVYTKKKLATQPPSFTVPSARD